MLILIAHVVRFMLHSIQRFDGQYLRHEYHQYQVIYYILSLSFFYWFVFRTITEGIFKDVEHFFYKFTQRQPVAVGYRRCYLCERYGCESYHSDKFNKKNVLTLVDMQGNGNTTQGYEHSLALKDVRLCSFFNPFQGRLQ